MAARTRLLGGLVHGLLFHACSGCGSSICAIGRYFHSVTRKTHIQLGSFRHNGDGHTTNVPASCSSPMHLEMYPEAQPLYFARAVYHTPSLSVTALVYFNNNLSRSFASTQTSARNGAMSSARQRARVRKRSVKRAAGSTGSCDAGKYVSAVAGGSLRSSICER